MSTGLFAADHLAAESLTFRTRPWRLLPGVLAGAAVAAGAWLGNARTLAVAAAALTAAAILVLVRQLGQRTTVDATGLTIRSGGRSRTVPWADIWVLRVAHGLLARQVMMRLGEKDSIPVGGLRGASWRKDTRFDTDVLALGQWSQKYRPTGAFDTGTPRARWLRPVLALALVALVAIFDRPDRWLPGDEVSALPAGCPYVSDETGDRLGLAMAAHEPSAYDNDAAQGVTCQWRDTGRDLRLTVTRHKRDRLHSGTAIAAEAYQRVSTAGPNGQRKDLDLGDIAVAYARVDPGIDQPARLGVVLYARRGNVVQEITLIGGRVPDTLIRAGSPPPDPHLLAEAAAVAADTFAALPPD